MKRTMTILAVILIAVMPWLLSCDDVSREATPAEPTEASLKDADDRQSYLDDLWQRGEDCEFEVVLTAVFKPEEGCNVTGVPPSWLSEYPEYEFNLTVQPYSLPVEDYGEITITISVPTIDSIELDLTQTQDMPIMRTIEYDGDSVDNFDPSAWLTISFHPNLRPDCGGYCFFGIEPIGEDGLYSLVGPQKVEAVAQTLEKRLDVLEPREPIDYPIIECATGIMLEIFSFSPVRADRWHVVDGCCGRLGEPIDTPCDW